VSANHSMEAEDILTPEQLAKRLQVGVSWVYEKSRPRGSHDRNPLPVLRCGRYLRFYWPDVCQWLRNGAKEHATSVRSEQGK
jgi:predicted DNA-binding transcriptional regulator AlpA